MDIRQLRHFLAVADAGSFTAAAQAIHLSQPALSQSILRLEHELGCTLFVRNKQNQGAGLIRTPAGASLYADATEIIESVERAAARARRGGHGQSRTRVAVGFTSATPRRFANAALKLSETAAGVEVLPVHLTWGDEHTALATGRVDLAFMQYPAGTTFASYFAAQVARVPRVALFHAAHRLAERASVSMADIADEPILDPGFGDDPAMHRGYWLGEPRAHGPVVGPPVRTVEEMCLFVAAERGMAITAGTIAEQYGRSDLAFVPIDDLDPVEFGLVRLRTDARPPVLAVFERLAGVSLPPAPQIQHPRIHGAAVRARQQS